MLFFCSCRLGVAMLGGKLYACGGYDGISFLNTVEMYDPATIKSVATFLFPPSPQTQLGTIFSSGLDGRLWHR